MRLDKGQIEVLDEDIAKILKTKSHADRIRIGFSLWTSSCNMLRSHLKSSHPDWSKEKVDSEVVRRFSRGSI